MHIYQGLLVILVSLDTYTTMVYFIDLQSLEKQVNSELSSSISFDTIGYLKNPNESCTLSNKYL